MTAMVATRPIPLKPRWHGHGDLMLAIVDDEIYVHADQLEQLVHLTPWAGGDTLLDDRWPLVINGEPYYALEVATARCEHADTPLAAEFLTWLREFLATLDDSIIDAAVTVPLIGSYPVKVAADTLTSAGITMTRPGLFAHLHRLGWTERTPSARGLDQWQVTSYAHRHGWLTTRTVPIHGGHLYPQVYVTPDGLAELFRTLGAPTLTPQPAPPALFD